MIALLNDPIRDEDSIKIMVDKKGEVIQIPTFKKRNPYTLQFDIPGKCGSKFRTKTFLVYMYKDTDILKMHVIINQLVFVIMVES